MTMKSVPAGWAVAAAGALLIGRPAVVRAEIAIKEPAPPFSLADAHGTVRSLAEFAGKFVVLEWFNNDCPFVGKHYNSGSMQQLQAEVAGRGVVWLTVVSSAPGQQGYLTPEQALAVIAKRGSHQTALLLDPDGVVGRRYGAKTTPHLVVIDPEGRVIYAGAIDDKPSVDPADLPGAVNYVRQALDESLAGRPVSVPLTKSYGCSVKY